MFNSQCQKSQVELSSLDKSTSIWQVNFNWDESSDFELNGVNLTTFSILPHSKLQNIIILNVLQINFWYDGFTLKEMNHSCWCESSQQHVQPSLLAHCGIFSKCLAKQLPNVTGQLQLRWVVQLELNQINWFLASQGYLWINTDWLLVGWFINCLRGIDSIWVYQATLFIFSIEVISK